MDRRRFLELAALGTAGSAGCAGDGGSGTAEPSETEPTRSRTTSPTSTGEPEPTATPREQPNAIFVDAEAGSNYGSGAADDPVATIQYALRAAEPGDTIRVRPGRHSGNVETRGAGEPDAPITVTGPPDAVFAPERGEAFLINHSHVHLRGLTFDGLHTPDRPDDPESYVERLIAINPRAENLATDVENPPERMDDSAYLRDVVVKPDRIGNCRADLIKHQYANDVEIGEFETFGVAGAKFLKGDETGHNSEIVYLGISWPGDGYPPEQSHDIHVHHIDNSAGIPHAELVDCKPGLSDVTIEYCTDAGGSNEVIADDTTGGAVVIAGTDVTVRWNVLADGAQAGIEIDCDAAASEDPPPAAAAGGSNNAIYGNRLTGNDGLALSLPYRSDGQGQADQRIVCGNEYDGETHGDPDDACGADVPAGDGIGHTGGDSPFA
ncbi:hypothetical protein [Halorarum halobium]|uniref:hypothetical protein n=1 Tax=Halorarum halobium TaxID=3075121 RepID=UPI0028AF1873|nr:hypothetical protein [Halobaculum sp. XH14]